MKSQISLQNVRIYLVDDSKAFTQVVSALLEEEGCKVKVFHSAESAIEVIFQDPPDIIVTDLEMPEISGVELIKTIREQQELSFIPILMLTSKDDPTTYVECIEQGADAFASKINIRQVLIAQIKALLRIAELKKDTIIVKQFHAVQNLIGTYKHEFGNIITILDGKLIKLSKEFSDINDHETFKSLQQCVVRLTATLEKLNSLRNYQEEKYSGKSNIVKI